MKIEDYYIEFDKLKVGDKVWHIQHGYIEITSIKPNGDYPIVTSINSYDRRGHSLIHNPKPNIYKKSPFEQEASEFPRIMMVQEVSSSVWEPRVIFMIKNDRAIAWNGARTFEEAKNICSTSQWTKFKEVEPEPVIIEKTLAEIAKELGIKPEQLRIKDK